MLLRLLHCYIEFYDIPGIVMRIKVKKPSQEEDM